MSKTSLIVREHGNPFCYLVESEGRPTEPYFVDLTARIDAHGRAHGECNCTFFQTTARPNWKRHGKFIPYRTDEQGRVRRGVSECKHLSAARNKYHLTVTMPLLAQYNGQQPISDNG